MVHPNGTNEYVYKNYFGYSDILLMNKHITSSRVKPLWNSESFKDNLTKIASLHNNKINNTKPSHLKPN